MSAPLEPLVCFNVDDFVRGVLWLFTLIIAFVFGYACPFGRKRGDQ